MFIYQLETGEKAFTYDVILGNGQAFVKRSLKMRIIANRTLSIGNNDFKTCTKGTKF